jgi:hypothetical protein
VAVHGSATLTGTGTLTTSAVIPAAHWDHITAHLGPRQWSARLGRVWASKLGPRQWSAKLEKGH